MLSRKKLLLSFLFLSLGSVSFASFQNQGVSVRSAGMANSTVAVGDDAGALFLNPAGTARLRRAEAAFMWEDPYAGIPDINVTAGTFFAAAPTRRGSFGFAFQSLDVDDLLSERVVTAQYARAASRWAEFGVNFKYLWHDYKAGNDPIESLSPVFEKGTSAGAPAVDLGVNLLAGRHFIFGLSGRNLNEPDVGLVSADKVPAEILAGAGWVLSDKFKMEAGASYRNQRYGASSDKYTERIGGEYWISRRPEGEFAVRLGVTNMDAAFGASFLAFPQHAFSLRFDYALTTAYALLQDSYGTHRVGVTVFFGPNRAPSKDR